ncbi:DUF72 domain-containing protein [Pedobacter sp. LMG 31464]|uniref:DUF72 domain-containing protein n=1 Tax=Pedobacter planticolens TaxID=2679964 RepID=A0A923DV87_9SPHI|nr:DUF72 domain-containing protein [Pedobacter planticolens]MBB2144542.1 DUF72 domain-containing protein [Pedobacter planticolens]
MEFGRVTEAEINTIDFTLPPDGEQTAIILQNLKPSAKPLYYVGCAKWGRKEWKDLIYPKKTKEADFLSEYVKHFNSIELNAVFYSIPKEEQILKWKEQVVVNTKGDFIFCPKFSRTITHIKRLKDADFLTDEYIKAISAFGEYLGPCFLQVSDNFGPNNIDILEKYLEKLPKDLQVFVEVRHKDWFVGDAKKQLFSMLAKLKKGAAITDASGRRDCLHMELPTPEAFIRFVGNGGKYLDSDKARVDEWVIRIKHWLDHGLQSVYFFLHQHDEANTPLIADYTIQEFNKHLGSDLSRINFITQNNLLF